jgi:HD-GYP domain-containing protein (c-di-GMP phosphodiesterase class II)
MFHDVGKIRTPDYILNKESPLTEDEFVHMMRHTVDGADILKVVDSLHKHIPATLYHHEWYNGGGYPEGLKGNEIPLSAAIISISDAYDAMTSSRPYRKAMSREEALQELLRCRGTQFAPHMVDAFVEVLNKHEGEVPGKTFLGSEWA